MSIDTTINPISIVAFILTCLGCVQSVVTISLTKWWSLRYTQGSEVDFGVWRISRCGQDGECQFYLSTNLEGGQEAFFVSKVFATLTALFAVLSVVAHVAYFCIRKPLIRTLAIFMLGAAALFGVLASCVFAGFYHSVEGDTSIELAFVFFVIGTITLLAAALFTAWATVRKLTDPERLVAF